MDINRNANPFGDVTQIVYSRGRHRHTISHDDGLVFLLLLSVDVEADVARVGYSSEFVHDWGRVNLVTRCPHELNVRHSRNYRTFFDAAPYGYSDSGT